MTMRVSLAPPRRPVVSDGDALALLARGGARVILGSVAAGTALYVRSRRRPTRFSVLAARR